MNTQHTRRGFTLIELLVVVKKVCHSRGMLSGIFHILLRKQAESFCLKTTKQKGDPQQKPSGMTPCFITVHGFTLIELLVVVLIIGILAAVAVPQYQKAVARTRAVEAITALKAITDAQEIYYVANGTYTDTIEDLDISVDEDGNYFTYACSKGTCKASPKRAGYPVLEFHMTHIINKSDALYYSGKHWCMVQRLVNQGASESVIEKARNLCASFGELDPDMKEGYHYLITH